MLDSTAASSGVKQFHVILDINAKVQSANFRYYPHKCGADERPLEPIIITVTTKFSRLSKSGAIKRVRFSSHGKAALFALPCVSVKSAKTMADWAVDVLRDSGNSMKSVEIMVAMKECVFEVTAPPSVSVASLERELKKSGEINKSRDNMRFIRKAD